MTDKRTFLKSGAMLAIVALAMRGVSLLFNSHITEKVGAEGMGLLSLTMSVYAFAVTFATSGISLAVTRLVAAALGRGEGKRAKRILRAAYDTCRSHLKPGFLIVISAREAIRGRKSTELAAPCWVYLICFRGISQRNSSSFRFLDCRILLREFPFLQ